MARGIARKTLGAEGYGLIYAHPLTYHGGFADHHTRTVVDKEPGTDLRARMNVDTGRGMRMLRDDAREQRQFKPV
jgi:hypothetical protein